MVYNLIFYIVFLASCFLLTYLSIFFSFKLKVIDKPDQNRKIHKKNTPLIGSLYFFSIFSIALILFGDLNINGFSFIFSISFACLSLCVLGFIDDKISLRPNSRLILYSAIFLISIISDENLIIDKVVFEDLDINFNLNLKLSIIFSVLCLVILNNAFNLTDGVNGILISYSFFLLSVLSLDTNIFLKNLNFLIIISLFVIFIFNLKGIIFLGSGGTNFLGCYIGMVIIYNFNNYSFLTYENIFLLLMVPGFDMLRVFTERILLSKNPMEADKNHLHHYLYFKYGTLKSNLIYLILNIIPFLIYQYFNINFLIIFSLNLIFFISFISFLKNGLKSK